MSKKGKILVADDEASLRFLLNKELGKEGYTVDLAIDGEDALNKIREEFYQVILLDISMPKKDGITVLEIIRKENILSEVIILTGNASIESAIKCMKLGAFDYVRKPYSLVELLILIERAIVHQHTQIDMKMLKQELKKSGFGGQIIGKSTAIKELRRMITRIASTRSTILILGESGSGKELVSRAIHEESPLKDRPFVAINCASLSETLLESELFGYEKGAFTDAKTQKRGLAEIADNGTLFLDEIGEIPLRFQAKLLRFLETGEIRRVGGTKDISLNVQILCATNKPLESLVAQGEFRADLYYRLNVITINVPPLREHREDIPLLVENILRENVFKKEIDKSAMTTLMAYDWPGNVRELKNVVERSCVLCTGDIITEHDLSFLGGVPTSELGIHEPVENIKQFGTGTVSLKEMERKHIINILKHVNGHKGKAADILKINPKTLYYKMKNYKIAVDYK
jgi:DNA-binding NtrC family response regulator